VIATPATMVALLQAVGLAWREATLSERAERVRELAVELCRRIAKFAEHLSNSGKGQPTRSGDRSRATQVPMPRSAHANLLAGMGDGGRG
jgi:DNA anti-recombination protein RmuC